jgi:hypothetical protein
VTAGKTSAISAPLKRGSSPCFFLGAWKVLKPCSPRRVDLGYQLCQGVTLLGFEFSQDGFEFFWHDLPPYAKLAAAHAVETPWFFSHVDGAIQPTPGGLLPAGFGS